MTETAHKKTVSCPISCHIFQPGHSINRYREWKKTSNRTSLVGIIEVSEPSHISAVTLEETQPKQASVSGEQEGLMRRGCTWIWTFSIQLFNFVIFVILYLRYSQSEYLHPAIFSLLSGFIVKVRRHQDSNHHLRYEREAVPEITFTSSTLSAQAQGLSGWIPIVWRRPE